VVRIFVEHPLLFVVRKYTLSFYLLKQQQPVEMHSSYAVAPNQTHYFTSLGMRNSVIQNQMNIEKIDISYENAITKPEDCGKMDDLGKPDDETFTNKIVDGIDFNLVLRTIPNKFRREASENLEVNGVIDTISSKIIPRWDDKQRSEAVKEVLGDDGEGIYAKILLNIFKVNEHIECTRSHKSFIEKTFHRFKTVFPHLQEKSILAHDQSKLRLVKKTSKTINFLIFNFSVSLKLLAIQTGGPGAEILHYGRKLLLIIITTILIILNIVLATG